MTIAEHNRIALRHALLGALASWVFLDVREQGGNNRGLAIRKFLAACDPPLAEGNPWCAAMVQAGSDVAALAVGVVNPLDAVKLEAYVQSYVDWARALGLVVANPAAVTPGMLACFSFGGARYDHIGVAASPVTAGGSFRCYEGNTSDASQRDGDAVALKPRTIHTGKKPVLFIDWTRALV